MGRNVGYENAARWAASLLREEDSNFRPLGYEPNELPLLHPAGPFYSAKSHSTSQQRSHREPKKNVNHRAMRDGPSFTVRANASLACPSRCTARIASFGAMYP